MNTIFRHPPRGSALFFGLLMVALLAALSLTFTNSIITNTTREESDVAGMRALQLADSYINLKVQQLWPIYKLQPPDKRVAVAAGSISSDAGFVKFGEGQVKCIETTVNYIPANNPGHVEISYLCMAVVQSNSGTGPQGMRTVGRQMEKVVSFSMDQSDLFDYVYFANNFGWMYGSTLSLYGNMGANGNLNFSGPPKVDGNLFAAKNPQIGAQGVINGNANYDNLTSYQNLAKNNPMMAPTNPAAPGVPFAAGYGGTQTAQTGQKPQTMPYLSDLTNYQNLAKTTVSAARPDLGEPNGRTGGVVKQLKAPGLDPTNPANYNILVNQTYGYNGENGAYANPTYDSQGNITNVGMQNMSKPLDSTNPQVNGNLALIGTPQQPIVILGPVVISNDLVIKGTITGQGTFYTGRNVNIVGDLTYANPPTWTQNDFNVNDTATANKSKDGVGFGAKGNVVMGDYTQASLSGGNGSDYWDSALQYISPGFTNPYPVDPKDANIGYVSYTDSNGVPWFNGDYTAKDGGLRYTTINNTGSNGNGNSNAPSQPRRFYESSFPKDYISSIATKPSNVQGIFYCNHYLGGRVNNYALYGTDIMRDEAIVTDGSANFYYDPRVSKGALNAYINLFLPQNPWYKTVLVHEVTGTQLQTALQNNFADAPTHFGAN